MMEQETYKVEGKVSLHKYSRKIRQSSSPFFSLPQSLFTRCCEADPTFEIYSSQAEKQADFLQRDLTFSAKMYY